MSRLPRFLFVLRGALVLSGLTIFAGCGPRQTVESLDASTQWKRVDYPKATIPLSPELRIMAWEEYLPDDLIRFFEETYGVDLIFDFIVSNEEMYERLQEEGGERYDLIMPSSYMIQKLINENSLRPLDHKNLTHLGDIESVFYGLDHDPGLSYSVPLFFGSTGIAVNVKYSTGLLLTWSEFAEKSADPLIRGRMGYFAEMRTGLGLALIMLEYSPNSRDPMEIAAARDLLLREKEEVGLHFIGSEIAPQLISGEIIMTPIWGGDAGYALSRNGFIRYIIPRGQSIVELDSVAIPANARSPETAEFLINFLTTPEVMAAMTDHSYFANTSSRARGFVRREIRNGPSYMRPLLNDIVFLRDVEEATPLYEEAWAEVINAPAPKIQMYPLPFDSPIRFGDPVE